MLREVRQRLQRLLEVTTDTRCCVNYELAALGVCVPRKLDTSAEIVAALKARGWRARLMLPDDKITKMNVEYGFAQDADLYPPTLRTLSTFTKYFGKGTFLIITTTGPVVLRDGKLIDYANRGINRRRLGSVYRLER